MNKIDIQIHPGNKDIAAQQHRDKHFFTHANATHLCFYTDGSLLEGKEGAASTYDGLGTRHFHHCHHGIHIQHRSQNLPLHPFPCYRMQFPCEGCGCGVCSDHGE